MISLSDVTGQHSLNKKIHSNKTLSSLNYMLSNDLMGPFQSIGFMCETLLEQKEISRKKQFKHYNLIRNATKFAQIKI